MPHGRYTLDQILQRSLPLCGALTKNCKALRFTSSPLITWDMSKAIPVWIVDGAGPQDGLTIHLVWDAGTGELMTAVRSVDRVTCTNAGTVLTCEEAQRITSSWLTTLGMSQRAIGWRPGSTTLDGFVWEVEWWTDTRGVAVTIDSRNGELIMALTKKTANEAEQRRIAQGKAIAALIGR
jgi:hypothetical protein